jgi:hypothetical protein
VRLRVHLFADSARPGLCRGCGCAVVWWDACNGRRVSIEVEAAPLYTTPNLRHHRFVTVFDRSAVHIDHCRAAWQWRSRRSRARSAPQQIDLFVE